MLMENTFNVSCARVYDVDPNATPLARAARLILVINDRRRRRHRHSSDRIGAHHDLHEEIARD